jgi:hypothetical protein
MAYKDPDVENFRTLFAPQVAALRGSTIPEQRASFDATMEPIPLAPGHAFIRTGVAAIDEAGQWMRQRPRAARLSAAA